MLFDFNTFAGLAERCYTPGPYSLGDVLMVFKFYFSKYEQRLGRPHPNIRTEQIRRIVAVMPYLDNDGYGMASKVADLFPDLYKHIITQHFNTNYRNCDYNINHFFSGKIRQLRYFEL